jgi:hypothetical protein
MTHPVDFNPPYMPTTMKGSAVEWAVAWPDQAGGWQRGEAISEDEARQAATLVPGAAVISREVLGWSESPVYVQSARYDGSMDALVDEIVEQENAVLRSGLERGADIAVTHMEKPGDRIAHRLSCPTLDTQLDRHTTWSPMFRERLIADRDFRPAMPSLFTRKDARTIEGIRSCKTCWPNVEGSEAPPSRQLFAEGLRTHHIDRMLADDQGIHLGEMEEVIIRRSSTPGDRFGIESVSVKTNRGTFEFEPRARVQVITARDVNADAHREAVIRQRVGLDAA